MIKIALEQGATVSFPNLGTTISMHPLGLRIRDRCGEQRLRNTILHNGVVLSVKDEKLCIKEPYLGKVLVAVSGAVEIEADYLVHVVSKAEMSRGGLYHPERGSIKIQPGDQYTFSVNGLEGCCLTASLDAVKVEARGKTFLELE